MKAWKLVKVDGNSHIEVEFHEQVYIVRINEPGHIGKNLYRYDSFGYTRQQVIDDYLKQGFIWEAEYARTL